MLPSIQNFKLERHPSVREQLNYYNYEQLVAESVFHITEFLCIYAYEDISVNYIGSMDGAANCKAKGETRSRSCI